MGKAVQERGEDYLGLEHRATVEERMGG
jgi:hypothetical protein